LARSGRLALAGGLFEHTHDVGLFMIRRSWPSIFTSVPDHLPEQHPVADL